MPLVQKFVPSDFFGLQLDLPFQDGLLFRPADLGIFGKGVIQTDCYELSYRC